VYTGIKRLEVVDVTLKDYDDPQAIFESLNSTGIDLSASDLIRNFILMRLPEEDQTRIYENIWSGIEDQFRGHENTFDNFARDYVALKTEATKQVRSDRIYPEFRLYWSATVTTADKLEESLSDIRRYAEYYAAFVNVRAGSGGGSQAGQRVGGGLAV